MTGKRTREEILTELRELASERDYEVGHARADELLLELIDDADVTTAYDDVRKEYA